MYLPRHGPVCIVGADSRAPMIRQLQLVERGICQYHLSPYVPWWTLSGYISGAFGGEVRAIWRLGMAACNSPRVLRIRP